MNSKKSIHYKNSLQKSELWIYEFHITHLWIPYHEFRILNSFLISAMNSYVWIHIDEFRYVNSKFIHMNSYKNSYTYEFIYEFRIYTYKFIYMNSYTHEFIWSFHIWIHIDNEFIWSFHIWIHMYMNSYIWIHIWIHVTYEFIWFFHIWIHMFHEFIYEFGCVKVPDVCSLLRLASLARLNSTPVAVLKKLSLTVLCVCHWKPHKSRLAPPIWGGGRPYGYDQDKYCINMGYPSCLPRKML